MVGLMVLMMLGGIEVAAPPKLDDGYEVRSVEVLRFSEFVRLPRLGGNFGAESLELDGGTELYIRLNGDRGRVYWHDQIDLDAPGPGGVVPLVQITEDGVLEQWVSGVWVASSTIGPVVVPIEDDSAGRWTAAGVWFVAGLGLWAILIRSVWQRSVML